jgi:hypothetical protein
MPNPTTIDGVLVALLSSFTPVTTILKGGIKPYANTVAKDKPYLTYYRITTDRPKSNDGPTGQAAVHYQLDAYADDLLTAKQAADAVRLAVDGYAGVFMGWKIDFAFITNEVDAASEPVKPGQALPVQRVTMDLTFSVAEPVPQRS